MLNIPSSFKEYFNGFWEPLKDGAPYKAQKAYEKWVNEWCWEDLQDEHPDMENPVFLATGEVVDDPNTHYEHKAEAGVDY